MPGLENGGAKMGSPGQNSEKTVAVSSIESNAVNDSGKSKTYGESVAASNFEQDKTAEVAINGDGDSNNSEMLNGFNDVENGGNGENFRENMSDLVEILSKLNPMAEEFVPPSLANHHHDENGFAFSTGNFAVNANSGNANGYTNRRKRNNSSQGKRRLNNRTTFAQREDVIRKTVYVSDIDLQVTEELLAGLFLSCGPVVDCRICGDPNSILRFAFIEFYKEEDAKAALNLSETILGYYPLKVMPSKTAIAPVNPTFLPRSEDEREMCTRTIYCTNIDNKITQADVKLFFESVCGEVQRMRLLGDYRHSTRIAFVEFTMAESAIAALNCSGVVLGSLPIRVSPSKTHVRPRAPRPAMH
ncbi:Polyadenylate-binding protein-interacting protein 10 [Hibiscus syriacus]|uniref:Polyadenylate-binding protein-interacting protein 10 n=1 Tax=Hibiscus syriacus TaxID=106335 RepID=A0A6A3CCT3_HIBSY|nr:polyadenylate-binding protein-interacting protein 12-like [Hibiscus syriacus]KAE8727003.1 Polyadenylate-binding protein-interacting protein 10 [Hibiscus syriacus]